MATEPNRLVFVANNFFQIAARFQRIDASDWTFATLHAKCAQTAIAYFSPKCLVFRSTRRAARAWDLVAGLARDQDASELKSHPSVGSTAEVLAALVYDAWLKAVMLVTRSVMTSVRKQDWWGRGQHAQKLTSGTNQTLVFYGTIRLAQQRGMPNGLARFAFLHLAENVLKTLSPNLSMASILQGIVAGTWSDVAIDSTKTIDPANSWKCTFDPTQTLARALYRMHVRTARHHFKDVHWSELRDLSIRQAKGLLSTSLTRITKREPRSLGILASISQANNITRAKSVPAVGLFRVTTDELVNLAELSWLGLHGATARAAWEGIILAISRTTEAWTRTSAISSKCFSGVTRLARLVADRLPSTITSYASARTIAMTAHFTRLDSSSWATRLQKHQPTEHLMFLHAAYHRLPPLNRMYAVTTSSFPAAWRTVLMSLIRAERLHQLAHLPNEILHEIAMFASPVHVAHNTVLALLTCTHCFARSAKDKHGMCVECAQ